ncbi:cation diffusion facilitator family transporter [Chlorobium sp. N1]|uniref:cation diffusion facilitator family transporter n=1 Tax=Chlorobium sp. N1 TaxID=2491138 RepID=UPI00103B9416|nr:cation diffusion facilitator family transporter [Chlorobium sp. N1]TCD46974.1 cation transporter [Chlorobium sp. N1]
METSRKKEQAAIGSVAASALLTLMKAAVGIMTGSIGILSEALHSALDFGAAALTWFAVRMSASPADRKHHYGHAKVESVSALIETGLLLLTSIWIVQAAVERLLSGSAEIEVTWYAVGVIVLSILVDLHRANHLKKVARETRSQALEADALHFSSDVLSSAVVLLGLGFAAAGIHWADPAAGIAVAVLVARAAISLGRKTIDILTDAAPEGIADRIEELVLGIEGVVGISKIRVKPSGPQIFVELSLTVSRTLSVEKVRDICSAIEKRVHGEFPVADMTIHTAPVALDRETIAERVHVKGLNHGLHAHNISTSRSGSVTHISFDVELDQQLTLRRAHDAVSRLEEDLRREFDGQLELCIHLDPLRSGERPTKPLAEPEAATIRTLIAAAADEFEEIGDVHDITILSTDAGKLTITLHCSFHGDLQLERAHAVTSRLEGAIYRAVPDAARVIVHAEPLPE